MALRDRRQKTFEFLNRLFLLISNPLPLRLINRQPWFFMIQRPYFILYISLSSSYTIRTCICTVYIPILYLFYTRILYFYSALYFDQKYIWSKPLFYTRLVSTILLMWRWTFQDIMRVSRSGVTHMLKNNKILYEIRDLFYFANYLS